MPKLSPNEEKVYKYLLEHKTPVHPDTLSKRFIWSAGRSARILNELVTLGLAELVQVGKKKFYKQKTSQ